MLVLGLSAYSHEASACLLEDGRLLAFVEEERVNREKHTWRFPKGAVSEILNITEVDPWQLDGVAVFWNPWKEITGNVKHIVSFFPQSLNLLRPIQGSNEPGFIKRFNLLSQIKKRLLLTIPGINPEIKVSFIDHHLAHAASCFLVSPFEKSAILTLDGRGESTSSFLGAGEKNKITKLNEWKVPHSVGHLYSAVTDYLGFRSFFDEYKVMGLSAYGTSRYYGDFKKIVRCKPQGGLELDLSYFSFHTHGRNKWLSPKFYRAFGRGRGKNEEFKQHHMDIAYALQKRVEDVAIHAAYYLKSQTGLDNLVIAGGVAQNCQMNRQIASAGMFKNIFIQPIANDAGAALGSALYYTHTSKGVPRSFVFDSVCLGPEYSDEQIKKTLEEYGVQYKVSVNIARDCAKYVAEGKIAGWFQGRMECGPRALGNRSILANPGDKNIRDRLNKLIKKREMFRPFAASVLSEHAMEYFELPMDSPFMQVAVKLKDEMRKNVPAIEHVDGTTRVQTVNKSSNPLFRKLIYTFYEMSGLPMVLNTSFNENEPIVMSPAHAIECFLRTGMDILCIGNFIIHRKCQ